MDAKTKPVRLRTLLADYPHTAALKRGDVTSDRVALDFADVTPVWTGFQSMVRRKAFDVSEMAIVTYLIAKSVGKSMVLLPAVMTARVQHAWAIYNGDMYAKLTPPELAGKRVGIRSFTTTTGAWLRGILANDYGVDLDSIDWVTFEGRRMPYRSRNKGEHYRLIVEAMRAKLAQNPAVRQILLSTGSLILLPDHIQEPNAPPEWAYFRIWMELRTELQSVRRQTP